MKSSDFIAGITEWRNIQETVQETFKKFHEAIVQQGDRIRILERTVEKMALKKEFDELKIGQESRPTFVELEKVLHSYSLALAQKIEAQAILLKTKFNRGDIKPLYKSITNIRTELELLRHDKDVDELNSKRIKANENSLATLNATVLEMNQKLASRSDVLTNVENLKSQLSEEIEKINDFARKVLLSSIQLAEEKLITLETEKLDIVAYNEILPKLSKTKEIAVLEKKIKRLVQDDLAIFKEAVINHLLADIDSRVSKKDFKNFASDLVVHTDLTSVATEVKMQVKERMRVNFEKNTRERTAELKIILANLRNDIVPVLNRKAFRSEVNSLVCSQMEVSHSKPRQGGLDSNQKWKMYLQDKLASLRKDIIIKAETKFSNQNDFETLRQRVLSLELIAQTTNNNPLAQHNKCNEKLVSVIGPINTQLKALKQTTEESVKVIQENNQYQAERIQIIEEKVGDVFQTNKKSRDLSFPTPQDFSIKRYSQSLFKYGRWIWKSGELVKQLIPWNIQVLNTFSEPIWTKDNTSLSLENSGLYEISFGVFCSRPPSIKLLLNEHAVFVSNGKPLNGIRGNKSKLTRRTHPLGNVTGWTFTEFLALPPNSKLSFEFHGDCDVQAFVSIKT